MNTAKLLAAWKTAKESLNSSQELRAAISVDNGQVIFEQLMRANSNNQEKVDSILLLAQGW